MLIRSVHIFIAALLALPGVATAAGVVQLPATNQTSCFDSSGNQRDCTGTGEDGEIKAGVAWPASRFTDNANGTITDNLSGLTWSKHANAPSRALPGAAINGCQVAESDMLWPDALAFIACLNSGNHAGFNDWRLPNLNELESMINAGVADTSAWLNSNGFGFGAGLPSQVRPSQYWTSTSDASAADLPDLSAAAAWEMDLVKGDFPFSILKNGKTNAVWPVRGVSSGPAMIWRTGQSLCFDDVGDTRPCAGTGEDGEKLAGAAWPAQRFATNAGATFALDRVSGLVWTTATMSPGPAACADNGLNLTWQEALDHVACLNTNAYLGRSDWRLPNRKELRSLADYSRGNPGLPAGHPFSDLDGLTYWTSTSDPSAPNEAWTVSMFDGGIGGAVKTGQLAGTLPAWPVSGPDLVPPALTITQGNMTTNVATQTISGTVEAGATVKVSVGNGAPAAATVTGTAWSFVVSTLAPGANTVTVNAADFSENPGTASITITLDTAAPVLSISPVTDRTNKKNQTIGGTVEQGAVVAVKMGATALPVTQSGADWSCNVAGLAAGANSITITATDTVGNVATQTVAINLVTPDGIITGGSAASVGDALRALRIAIGIVTPTADDLLHADVAPLGAPDDKIEVSDVLLILRKAVGLASY